MATEPTSSTERIDIRGVPATIRWTENEPRHLGDLLTSTPVSLDAVFDPSNKVVSFRLCTVLFRRHSKKPVPIYLLIRPQQVHSIAWSQPLRPSEDVAGSQGGAICLEFHLNSPATLVTPLDPMRLNDKSQVAVLKLVRSAGRQTFLSICISDGVIPAPQLTALCEAKYQDFEGSSRHANIDGLYGGQGGKVVDVDETESPPSYNELEPPPPMAPVSHGKLRRSCMLQVVAEADCLKTPTQPRPRPPRSAAWLALILETSTYHLSKTSARKSAPSSMRSCVLKYHCLRLV